jgi:hypothetical protein
MTPRNYADLLVERLREYTNNFPGVLEIHWDDCCMDERRFWFHFHAPQLAAVRVANSKQMLEASHLVRACMRESHAILKDCPYSVEWCFSRHDAPEASYNVINGQKEFNRYNSQTWIKVISFYG